MILHISPRSIWQKVLLSCLIFATSLLAIAQPNTRSTSDFTGTWKVTEPGGKETFVILRSSGAASKFGRNVSQGRIIPGNWTFENGALNVLWESGNRHQFAQISNGFEVTYFTGVEQTEAFTTRTEKVPSEHLGAWAVDPNARSRESTRTEDIAVGFFGNWQVTRADDTSYFIIVEDDRSATTTWRPDGTGQGTLRGAWSRQGSELHITWENGWYTIIQPEDRTFQIVNVASGGNLETDRTSPKSARRVRSEVLPTDWLTQYEAERERFRGGISFSSRREAQRFYRGEWIVERQGLGLERISLSRFGGISTSRRASLDGEWRLSGQDLFLNWDDGLRQVISAIGTGFVLFEFEAGRPVDAVPSRIFRTTPADRSKLEAFEQARMSASHALHEDDALNDALVGPSETTFLSRLWPFGRSEYSEFPEDTFVVEPPSKENDPWWWPFWSEQEAQAANRSGTSEVTSAETSERTPEEDERQADTIDGSPTADKTPTRPQRSARNSDWIPTY